MPQQHNPNGIEIDTSGYDRVPASTLSPGSIFLWLGVDCTVESTQPVEPELVRYTYRHAKDDETHAVTFGNTTNMLVKRKQGSETNATK